MNWRLPFTPALCSLILLLCTIASHAASAGAATKVTPGTIVHGRVFDRRTGRPVPTATISAEDLHGLFQTRTQADRLGRYTLGPIPPGLFFLVAKAPDYSEKFHGEVIIGKGAQILMDFSLRYAGAIRGVVRKFPSGRPLAGVAVTAIQAEYPWTGFGTAGSDAHGRFVIYNLDAVGRNGGSGTIYEVSTRASMEGYRERSTHVTVGMPLRPHRVTGHVRFRFRRTLRGSVRGRVTDEARQPLPNVNVEFLERDNRGESNGSATTNSRGYYRITGLDRPGRYLGLASSDEVYPQYKTIKLRGPRVIVQNFRTHLREAITGIVTDKATGKPVQAEVSTERGSEGFSDYTDDHGVFRIENLQPGRYDVVAEGPGYSESASQSVYLCRGQVVELTFQLTRSAARH